MIRKPTAAQIRTYRDKHGCGVVEAKAALMKRWRAEMLMVLKIQCSLGETNIALSGLIDLLSDEL